MAQGLVAIGKKIEGALVVVVIFYEAVHLFVRSPARQLIQRESVRQSARAQIRPAPQRPLSAILCITSHAGHLL
jgi:hypothetical protein